MSYSAWQVVHRAAAILFLGNIITGVFWARHARRAHEFRAIEVTFDGLTRSDRWFTAPSALLLLLTGLIAARRIGFPVLGTGWLLWASAAFAASGILFGARVAPLQRRILDLARRADGSDQDWRIFGDLYRRWELFGILSITAAIVALGLMLLKPALPGL